MSNTVVNKSRAAILVDYDLYKFSPEVQRWVEKREGNAELVMMVSNPQYHDYDPEAPEHEDGPQFPVVLRNTNSTPDLVFKTTALCVIQDMSNLIPVVVVDPSFASRDMFLEGGVLVALAAADVHYDE